MFGDFDDVDVSRVGSPWDSLLSSSPSPVPTPPSSLERETEMMRRFAENVPRLTPEIEEGNVEYKLRLINPSEERFARLVTQLKWRLGAGAGQAYYEIGVADSGQLVGLQRKELEQSLETLEMMAGEIGASVIIVKEIEVPAAMLELSARTRKWIDMPKNTRIRKRGGSAGTGSGSGSGSGSPTALSLSVGAETGTETETTTTDAELDDDLLLDLENGLVAATSALTLRAPLAALPDEILIHPPYMRSHPDRPTAQSSPSIMPVYGDTEADADVDADIEESTFTIDLEINEVYKPRPTRRRTPVNSRSNHNHIAATATHERSANVAVPNAGRRGKKDTAKDTAKENKSGKTARLKPVVTGDKTTKAEMKRLERDRRREAKRKALAGGGGADALPVGVLSGPPQLQIVAPVPTAARVPIEVDAGSDVIGFDVEPPSPQDRDDELEILPPVDTEGGPRLIVEVLVVRKSSLEESYQGFGDFSLDV